MEANSDLHMPSAVCFYEFPPSYVIYPEIKATEVQLSAFKCLPTYVAFISSYIETELGESKESHCIS